MSAAQDHSWFACLHVIDAAGYYRELVNREVEIWHTISDQPGGTREFAIVTPDGHRIVFRESLSISS